MYIVYVFQNKQALKVNRTILQHHPRRRQPRLQEGAGGAHGGGQCRFITISQSQL